MGFSVGGLQQFAQAAATTVAQLASQAVSMLSLTLTQTAGNVALQTTTGARLKLGSGTTDYLTSDGATTITAGGVIAGVTVTSTAGAVRINDVNANAGMFSGTTAGFFANSAVLRGAAADGATSVGVTILNLVSLTTAGSKIVSFVNSVTEKAFIDLNGSITQGIGTGATAVQPGGILNLQSTPASNVNTGETDLFTYSMPANTMTNTNRGISVSCYGSNLGSATTKTLKFYFGTAIQTVTLPITNAGDWELTATVVRTSLSNQRFAVRLSVENDAAATVASFTVTQGTATQTETGAITVKVTGTDSVGSGAITANLWTVSAL